MFEALLERTERSIEAVRRHVVASNAIRSMISERRIACRQGDDPCFDIGPLYDGAPDPTDWKIIDHCSAVTRLYAIYEQFVHELLKAFLAFLENNSSYASLDEALRAEHRRALGQLLINLDKERYRNIRLETIIKEFASAFSDEGRYRLLPEALLSHDQNLRLTELAGLCRRCGILNVERWLNGHRFLKQFFSDQTRQSDRTEAELKQLVDYRNEAAHGGMDIDAVLGSELLIEYADFLSALFRSFTECIQWSIIEESVQHNKLHLSGKISETYSRNIVVTIVENSIFSVGDSLYLRGENYCYRANILSLQLDDVDMQQVITLKPIELGICLDISSWKGGEIFLLNGQISTA